MTRRILHPDYYTQIYEIQLYNLFCNSDIIVKERHRHMLG